METKAYAESAREALAVRLEKIEATVRERVEAGEPIVAPEVTPDEVMAKAAAIMEDACSRTLGTPEVGEPYIVLPAYLDRIEVTTGFTAPEVTK